MIRCVTYVALPYLRSCVTCSAALRDVTVRFALPPLRVWLRTFARLRGYTHRFVHVLPHVRLHYVTRYRSTVTLQTGSVDYVCSACYDLVATFRCHVPAFAAFYGSVPRLRSLPVRYIYCVVWLHRYIYPLRYTLILLHHTLRYRVYHCRV